MAGIFDTGIFDVNIFDTPASVGAFSVVIGGAPLTINDASPISLTVTWSEDTSDFVISDVVVTGGSATSLTGGPAVYTLVVTPDLSSNLIVTIPAGSATNATGDSNLSDAYVRSFLSSTIIAAWPSTLPDCPLFGSWGEALASDRIDVEEAHAANMYRTRSSLRRGEVQFAIFVTKAQKVILDEFFKVTTKHGSKRFTMSDASAVPNADALLRFTEPPRYSWNISNNGFTAAIKLMRETH